jgi:hypothetical protein
MTPPSEDSLVYMVQLRRLLELAAEIGIGDVDGLQLYFRAATANAASYTSVSSRISPELLGPLTTTRPCAMSTCTLGMWCAESPNTM